MKIEAGKALNQRKPTQAPTRQAESSARFVLAVGDEGDRRVGEQDDRAAAGGQAVEAVGEVDAVGRAGDHEEDEHG